MGVGVLVEFPPSPIPHPPTPIPQKICQVLQTTVQNLKFSCYDCRERVVLC
jgi:hypothetical protein